MAITGLDTITFTAPDMAEAKRFFTDWGLKRVSSGKSTTVFETAIGSRVVLRPMGARDIPPAATPGMNFREMIWGVSSKKHLAEIKKELSKDREVTVDKDGTVHCLDPNNLGVGFRLWKHKRTIKTEPTVYNSINARKRINRTSPAYSRANPLRMGHIGFIIPDLKAAEAFYHKRLGFPVSDRYAGGAGLFLRCAEESDHHNLFMIWSDSGNTRFHHVAFEVRDIHEVFGGGKYFESKGWKVRVGPGRHPISSAYFWYFHNPCEGAVEYFTDSDWVTKAWKPTSFRVNRFSEWHLPDGLGREDNAEVRPSLAAAGKQ